MKHYYQDGQILIITMVFMLIMLALSGAILGYTTVHVKGTRSTTAQVQALEIAQAGIEKAIYELNQNSSYTGETDTVFGNGEFSTVVTDVDSVTKLAQVTSYVPNNTNPVATKTVKVKLAIDTTTVSFNYGVQVGADGLVMSNSSAINGNVFSNGNISGSGTITGDASVAAGTAAVADQECTTYSADYTFANNDSTKRDIGQKFTPTVTGALSKVQLYIKKTGSPANLTVRIMPHNSNGDKPSHTGQLGGSGTLASVGTTFGWVDVSFSTAPNLTAGTIYWVVIDSSGNSSSNYYTIGVDASEACAGAGKYTNTYSSSSAVWQPINGGNGGGADLNFKTFFGGGTTTLSGVTVQGNARAQAMSSCTVGGNAYYENGSTSCTVTGSSNSGVAAPAQQAMPISDSQINDWKADAEAGGSVGTQNISSGTVNMGPKKITGNLNVSNTAILNLTGPVWVTGTITLSNSAIIRVDSGMGNTGVVMIADGAIYVSNSVQLNGNGNANSYILALSTTTGAAITLSNSADGAIFYASNGTIYVSNSMNAKQLTGYGINISNSATITYQTGLASATFSNGPGASWAFQPGSYVIEP